MDYSHNPLQPSRGSRRLFAVGSDSPVAPADPADPFDPLGFGDDDGIVGFARRQTDLFRHLIALVGDADALWRLDTVPIPDEPFDWSAVETGDQPFVTEVLALSDRCCDALLDTEFRTIARRVLARVAVRDPRVLRRATRVDRSAAALVWLAGQASGEFGRRSLRTARLLWDWFGVGNCSDRGYSLRNAAGLVCDVLDPYPWHGTLSLGDPSLLHSKFRAKLIAQRDAMLEIASRRRTWSLESVDGGTARVRVSAEATKVVSAVKGIVGDGGRAMVIVGFGEHVEDAHFVLLSVPDAHDLVRMLQHALDAPLPRSR